jgi:proline iminopeptidase
MTAENGRLVDIGDTQLYVVERGAGYPLLCFHGGPGLDHHVFGDYLDALTDKYQLVLVDQRNHGKSDRAPEATWTLQQNAKDVGLLAAAMGFDKYAVLGHSYGAFVVLQHAADYPGQATQTIVSSGLPSASRFLADYLTEQLENFEPESMRQKVVASWENEASAQTQADVAALLKDQMPFHFRNPLDPIIDDFNARTTHSVYAPEILRKFAVEDYGGIEVEDQLGEITQPVLVLAGKYDRVCSLAGGKAIAAGIPNAALVVFENSAHMTYVEENEKYVTTVRRFLDQHTATA